MASKKEPSAGQIVKLNKIIPALDAMYTDTGAWVLSQGWRNYSRLGVDIPYFQTFIDLAGYTRQNDLTFPTAIVTGKLCSVPGRNY